MDNVDPLGESGYADGSVLCAHVKFAGNTAFATESVYFLCESLVKHGESARHRKRVWQTNQAHQVQLF